MSGSSFFRCRLSGADLTEAVVEKSNLNQSDLKNATFYGARASGALFRRARLVRTIFTHAVLDPGIVARIKRGRDGAPSG